MSVAGGCRCGAVRYTVAIDALPLAYACHCTDCQSWSGSAFSQQAVIAETSITIAGPIVDYSFRSPSGAQSHQRMCGICHARIYNTNSSRPGIAMLRAGTLDESDRLDTPVHIWAKRKQPWLILADDAEVYPEAAPPEAIIRLFVQPSAAD
ncbi:GFA family protein [soil metagenome]